MPWEGKHWRLTLRITGVWGSGVGGDRTDGLGRRRSSEDLSELVMFHLGAGRLRSQALQEARKNIPSWGSSKAKRALRNKHPEGM